MLDDVYEETAEWSDPELELEDDSMAGVADDEFEEATGTETERYWDEEAPAPDSPFLPEAWDSEDFDDEIESEDVPVRLKIPYPYNMRRSPRAAEYGRDSEYGDMEIHEHEDLADPENDFFLDEPEYELGGESPLLWEADEAPYLSTEDGSGIELAYQTATRRINYVAALHHALRRLRPNALVIWSDGTRSRGFGAPWVTGKYTKRFWVRKNDPIRWGGSARSMLVVRRGRSAYDAFMDLVKTSKRWTYECASYIQAAHLYALARSRGRKKVENWFKTRRPSLRYHRSNGLRTRFYFRRQTKTGPWRRALDKGWKLSKLDDATLLRRTAVGSRVMWHNIRGKGSWKNENTVKVGRGRYKAFPLFRYRPASADQVSLGLASYGYQDDHPGIDRDAMEDRIYSTPTHSSLADLRSYRDANVFLREVEIIGPSF